MKEIILSKLHRIGDCFDIIVSEVLSGEMTFKLRVKYKEKIGSRENLRGHFWKAKHSFHNQRGKKKLLSQTRKKTSDLGCSSIV